MHRLFFYSVFILISLVQPAIAQDEIVVRTGEHDEYSRLVFDWGKRVPYSIESPESGRLVITFEKEAGLKSKPPGNNPAKNIFSFEVLSNDPLSVAVDIPQGARTRNFWAGNRVVVDVYSPPGGVKKTVQAKSELKPTPKVEPKKQSEAPPVEPAPVEKVEKRDPAKDIPAEEKTEDIELVEKEDAPEPDEQVLEEPEQPPPLVAAKKERVRPNMISFSSSTSQGLSVFEVHGELWIVTDKPDPLLSPQVSGPDVSTIAPLQTIELAGAKAYKTKMLEGAITRGEGGGLIWRVVISPEERKFEPIEPVREGVKRNAVRSGRVLFPLQEIGKLIDVPDPVSGRVLKVVTVKNSKFFSSPVHDFVDFTALLSPIGLSIMPKVDDLEVKITDKGVVVSRPGGLAVQSQDQFKQALVQGKHDPGFDEAKVLSKKRVFKFRDWELGGVEALGANANIMLGDLHSLTDATRVESLITLGKMYLANAQGAEALGFFKFAQLSLPDLEKSPEFIALRAAAQALNWKSELALNDFLVEELKPFEEIGYWKSYVLADLGDWQQAIDVLPEDLDTLFTYPDLVFNRIALVLAEVYLRAGDVGKAERLLNAVDDKKSVAFEPQIAALNYLKGEASRQNGDVEKTKEYWEELVDGKDDLYRAKAGLALTRLLVNEKELESSKAIDRLERLRYAWRGDLLEAQIYYWLGKTYFEASEYVKGLNIMREAAAVAAGTNLGGRIAAEMSEAFTTLFLTDELMKVSPPEAAALYEQFAELVPPGSEGNKVGQMLAERLVQADLLERAANLLSFQLEHRLKGEEAYRIGARLAAIRLIDGRPSDAMDSLAKANQALRSLPAEEQTQDKLVELSLLRARALSQQQRPDRALELLEDLARAPDVNRLRADIAWNAGYWDDAAEALGEVILDQNISLTRPLDEENANLLVQRAVALNLASDRIALANMREKYTDAVAQTGKGRIFEVITRPRQNATLADRETLMGVVSEVDLFEGFLNSYRAIQTPSN